MADPLTCSRLDYQRLTRSSRVLRHTQNDLIPLAEEGVKGFKCFLIESGVDEFPCVNEAEVLLAMEKLNVRPHILPLLPLPQSDATHFLFL